MEVTFDSIRDISLYQSKIGYRFSVDSLLLYDFVNLREVKNIADLGAGSGIIGILLAKKYPGAKVRLFEIQDSLVRLAEKNVVLNRLENRVRVSRYDLRTLHAGGSMNRTYDLIVSNPPFRKRQSGRINTEEEKAIARHEITLSLNELLHASTALLRAKGRLCLIYHPNRLAELLDLLREKDIEPKRIKFVHSNTCSEAKMVLLEAAKEGRTGLKVEPPLYIYKEDGSYTKEMKKIYNPEIQ